jgi:bacillithiol biosynthesis deacetylase BshB1
MLDVIAFAAHPDDAEAACGGLLFTLAARGYRVAICDLTRGERGTNGSPEIRAAEAAAAARVLGLAARLQLGLPDGGLDGRASAQLEAVVRAIREHAPRIVIGPHEQSRHPDHLECAQLVRRAQFFCGLQRFLDDVPPVARPVHLRGLDWHPVAPSFVVDISAALTPKLEALRCYGSQFESGPGRAPTVLNDPAWMQRIETNARHYGSLIGRAAGEPYVVDGPVPLDDPVRTFTGEARA